MGPWSQGRHKVICCCRYIFLWQKATSFCKSLFWINFKVSNWRILQPTFENLQEEEEESSSESAVETDVESEHDNRPPLTAQVTDEQQQHVDKLLAELHNGQCPQDFDEGHKNTIDTTLNGLNYKDFPALRWAHAWLAVKAKDLKLDVTFWARITSMVGTLNLYLDHTLGVKLC